MKKSILISLLIEFLFVLLVDGADIDKNYINTLIGHFSSVTIDEVKGNSYGYDIKSIVSKLRKMDEEGVVFTGEVLIRMKDQQTIDKYMKLFIDSKGASRDVRRVLSGSCAPWLIPELINLISDNEIVLVDPDASSWGYHGLDGESLKVLHFITRKSVDLNEETRVWASQITIRSTVSTNKAKDVYLQWWNINKKAIEAGDYKNVVPLKKEECSS